MATPGQRGGCFFKAQGYVYTTPSKRCEYTGVRNCNTFKGTYKGRGCKKRQFRDTLGVSNSIFFHFLRDGNSKNLENSSILSNSIYSFFFSLPLFFPFFPEKGTYGRAKNFEHFFFNISNRDFLLFFKFKLSLLFFCQTELEKLVVNFFNK